jgi:hypothetical protein
MRYWLASVALLLLLPSAARTEIGAMGMGTDSCANFGKNYQHNPESIEAAYFTWAQGFINGANITLRATRQRTRLMDGMPLADQKRFIRQYCDDHPLSSYLSGVIELMGKFPSAAEMPPNGTR